MRILHTLAGRNLGGIEFRVFDQTDWLLQHGHFAAIAAHPDSAVAALAQQRNVPLVPIDFDKSYAPYTLYKLRRELRNLRIGLIDCHGRRDSKTAAFCQDLCTVVRSRHFSQLTKNSLRRRLEWRKGCSWVIATCEIAARGLIASKLAVQNRLSVVGEWASDEFFDKADQPWLRDAMRRRFRIADDSFVVATIGMLRPDKCQEDLLRTVARLRATGTPAVALVIGSATQATDAYEGYLKRLAAELGIESQTIFTGFCSEVATVIQAADAVLVPSLMEAWSRVVPEAFAARLPVVASRVGGLPELVLPNVSGWLAEPRSIDDYAYQLEEIRRLPNKTAAIVAAARAYADRCLHFDAKMDETLRAYRAALVVSQPHFAGIGSPG